MAHDQAGCCSESGPSALALALFITALPPPSRADVGQPDHDNVSAAGLQLEAPLNEHEPVRGGGAGDAAQGDGDGRGGGAGGGGGGSGGDGRGVGPPAFAAGLWASSQLNVKSRRGSFSGHFSRHLPRIWRRGPVCRTRP